VPLFLVRFAETGREAQPGRSKTRRDIEEMIRAALPGAAIRAAPGRLLVEAPEPTDAGTGRPAEALGTIHGIASFSPCEACELGALEACVVRVAGRALAGRTRFRVQVKRAGAHGFTSRQKSAALGACIQMALPHAVVDLAAPEVVIGVEIRDRDCYVFDQVVLGMDHVEAPGTAEEAPALPAPVPAFLVDHMLGRLVKWLRLLGFDAIYARDEADSELLRRARHEQRIILTRDRALSQAQSAQTLFVQARTPLAQLAEVARRLSLGLDEQRMFTRCSLCNGLVQPVDKEQVRDRLPEAGPEADRDLYDELTYCAACDKVYWKGTQYDRIVARLVPLFAGKDPDAV
jgi:uncharacterized protein with PIN domain